MSRLLKLVGSLVLLVVVLASALYAYRSLMLFEGRTPEGYQLLTAVPGSDGFEPKVLPKEPVLENQAVGSLAFNFGYKVGNTPYSYSVALNFPGQGETGKATVTVRHGTRDASVETNVVRRWDEPRQAYSIALQDKFDVEPAVPSLCIKAVIGPNTANYDLNSASVCIAQRDVSGNCHPETLACGLIR
jgi:hypothetical protein